MSEVQDSQVASLFSRYGDAAGSIASAFAMQGFLVISGVIAARALGVEHRGHFALLSITPAVMTQVATLGLPLAATYFIANEHIAPGRLFASLWPFAAGLAALLLGVHAIVLLVALRGQEHEVALAGLATVIVTPGVVCQLFGLALLQGQQRFRAFNLLRPLPLLVHGVILATLFLLGVADLPMVALSWAASTLSCGVLVLVLSLKDGKTTSRAKDAQLPSKGRLLRFGLKSLLGYVTPLETFRIDQIVVGLLIGPAALGLYVVGLSFTNLPRMIGQSIGMVAYPQVAASVDRRLAKQTFVRFIGVAALSSAGLVAVLGLSIGALVPFFFGPEFFGSIGIARILLLSAFLFSMRRVVNECVRGLSHPEWGAIAEVASWIALLPGLALLLPSHGVEGVAWTLVGSSALGLFVLGYLTIRNEGPQRVKAGIEQPETIVPAA